MGRDARDLPGLFHRATLTEAGREDLRDWLEQAGLPPQVEVKKLGDGILIRMRTGQGVRMRDVLDHAARLRDAAPKHLRQRWGRALIRLEQLLVRDNPESRPILTAQHFVDRWTAFDLLEQPNLGEITLAAIRDVFGHFGLRLRDR